MTVPRKPVQIAISDRALVLCEDGTLWVGYYAHGNGWHWERLPPIPGDKP
jgi:hypothetical protein